MTCSAARRPTLRRRWRRRQVRGLGRITGGPRSSRANVSSSYAPS
jgi:hypothetical protein